MGDLEYGADPDRINAIAEQVLRVQAEDVARRRTELPAEQALCVQCFIGRPVRTWQFAAMNDDLNLSLAADFPAASREDWLALVSAWAWVC